MYFYQRYFIDETIVFYSGSEGTMREVEGFYITIDEEEGVAILEVEGPKESDSNIYSKTRLLYSETIPLSGRGIFVARYADGEPVHIGDAEDRGEPI